MKGYQSHRSGVSGFSFGVGDPGLIPNKSYKLQLGFAEVYTPNCEVGKRLMNIRVNDPEFVTDLDVFKEAGCDSVLVLERDIRLYSSDAGAIVTIQFESTIENPMAPVNAAPTCVPTVGQCASTAEELEELIDATASCASRGGCNATVAICDGATITTSGAIKLQFYIATLCCAGSNCAMESNGSDSIFASLRTMWSSVALPSLMVNRIRMEEMFISKAALWPRLLTANFLAGRVAKRSGNICVESPGGVYVSDSEFVGALAGGGLLGYSGSGSVSIFDSDFIENSGGGAILLADLSMTIGRSNFIENSGGRDGGGLRA